MYANVPRSVSDLRIACQILFGQQDSEGQGSVAPVPFRETDLPQSLKFGYYIDGQSAPEFHRQLAYQEDLQTGSSKHLPQTSGRSWNLYKLFGKQAMTASI
jgi:hypothetical protein